MIEFYPITNSNKFLKQFWHGKTNGLVRYWTYMREGMGLLNEFRYYVMFFFGSLWTFEYIDILGFHIPQYVVLTGAVIAIPLLIFAGRWQIYRANKPQQYISTMHGNITQFQSHNMNVFQTELLKAIAEKMGVDVKELKTKLEE